jgi:LAO/AO transport system kinase
MMTDDMARLVAAARGEGPAAVRAAARLMSLLVDEPSRLPRLFQAYATAQPAADARFPFPRLLVGITGAPGCGKSTLTDSLVRQFRARHPSRRVGVIAVDPSSPFTGGAVLGDRVRMMRHATDPLVFVRSLATRGHLGGLTLGVKGVIRVMALAGCDVVFVETVGVGQSEVEIASVADLVMIVLAPGQGDSIQLLKAGLMEIGDLLVVNKADRPDAARLHSQVLAMLELATPDDRERPQVRRSGCSKVGVEVPKLDDPRTFGLSDSRPRPRAYLVSAEEKTGIEELAADLDTIGAERHAQWQELRQDAVADEIREAVLCEAKRRLADTLSSDRSMDVERIVRGETTVEEAAEALLRVTAGRERGRA